jgi:CDGSH-type Zn-finger protein
VKEGEEKYWCACGLSKNQPFCDGSHSATDITPMKFVAKASGAAYLCMCKHTQNAPYCDGAHAKLE